MLKNIFTQHFSKFTDNQTLIAEYWQEMEKFYQGKKRFYHTLQHIENLYLELEKHKEKIEDWDILLCSIFYHDIIYDVKKQDNEERSADVAAARLLKIGFPKDKIEKCYRQIVATKKHEATGDFDTDIFTDADLAILGSDWETYEIYTQNIRKEYSIYPDFLYNMGRKKVLKHFLDKEKIYKTPFFFEEYEAQAKINLKQELLRF